MTDHEVKIGQIRYGNAVFRMEDGEFVEEYETENDEYVGQAFCSCGEDFRTAGEAEEHLKEVSE